MSLIWKLKRLSVMSPREIAYRAGRDAQRRWEALGIGRARDAVASGTSGAPWLAGKDSYFEAAAYVSAAERILSGRFDVFALSAAPLGFPPSWNRDPKTGIQAPMRFGKSVDYRDDRLVGDIKYLWEPNRHLELVTLAQAWRLTREERFAAGCRRLLESWFEQCPYPLGPNWSSSLEHAIRLVNWSAAWELLGGQESACFAGSDGERFRRRWLRCVHQHCHFIAGHLSRHSSANNHLLGELTGLFVGSATWPLWPDSARWREQARGEIETQVGLQVAGDGVNREQALWYHHSVADMILVAGLVARANRMDFGTRFWSRLEAMLGFVAGIMDVQGQLPAFGDSDDGMLMRLSPAPDFNVFRSLLATGSVLFGRADFQRKAGSLDEKSRWLLPPGCAERFEQLAAEPASPARRVFPEGGYYVLGDAFDTASEVRLVADAGPLGFLAIGAHGHADSLSFTLSVGGVELLIDPGTFAYHTDKPWRDYFRGTSAHNTVRIDEADQSVSGGNFLWIRHAATRVTVFESNAVRDRLVAGHDGYRRLADPVDVNRAIEYDKQRRLITVEDELRSRGSHRLELHWHFTEKCRLTLEADHARVEAGSVRLTLHWPAGLQARTLRGSEHPIGGWRSRRYDVKAPIDTLVLSGSFTGAWRGTTRIELGVPS